MAKYKKINGKYYRQGSDSSWTEVLRDNDYLTWTLSDGLKVRAKVTNKDGKEIIGEIEPHKEGFLLKVGNFFDSWAKKSGEVNGGSAFVPYSSQGTVNTTQKASGVAYKKSNGEYETPDKETLRQALHELNMAPFIIGATAATAGAASSMGLPTFLGSMGKDIAVGLGADSAVKLLTNGEVNGVGEAARNFIGNTTGFLGFDNNTQLGRFGNSFYNFGTDMVTPGYRDIAKMVFTGKPSTTWALRMMDSLNSNRIQFNFIGRDFSKPVREGETFPVFRIEGVKYPEEWGIRAATKAKGGRRSLSTTYRKNDRIAVERTARFASDNRESLHSYFADRIARDFENTYKNLKLSKKDVSDFLATGKLPKGVTNPEVTERLQYIRNNYDLLYNNSLITEHLYKNAGSGVTPLIGTVTKDGITAPVGFNYTYLPIEAGANGYRYRVNLDDLVYDPKLKHYIPRNKGSKNPVNTKEYTNTDGIAASMGYTDVSKRIRPTIKALSDVPLISSDALRTTAEALKLPVNRFSRDWFSVPNVNDGYGSFGTTYIIPE